MAEAVRNLACSGATPLGTTDNLNFGNPFNPEIFFQLRESVRGVAEACRVFDAPVTGGNVSLYNQSPAGAIDPTPTVAVVGMIEKEADITTQWFKNEGDVILLLGSIVDTADPLLGLGGSAYLRCIHGLKTGNPPQCDLELEKRQNHFLVNLIRSGLVRSAHDCSEGGFLTAVAECCISQQWARETPHLIGATIEISDPNCSRLDALLFGETQGRVVLSVAPAAEGAAIRSAAQAGVSLHRLGRVGGSWLELRTGDHTYSWPLEELHDLWWNSIARLMQ